MWSVTDNSSANGTFVNGARIPAEAAVELRPGDRIGFGSCAAAAAAAPGEGAANAAADDAATGPRFHFAMHRKPPGVTALAAVVALALAALALAALVLTRRGRGSVTGSVRWEQSGHGQQS